MARLTAEMSDVMSKMSVDPAASASTPEDIAKMSRELEEFTHRMEAEGVKPEDLLKAILGEDTGTQVLAEVAQAVTDLPKSESKPNPQSPEKQKSKSKHPTTTSGTEASSSSTKTKAEPKPKPGSSSFEDTIRKTMARMESSSAAAASATAQASAPKSEEDMLAEMLRALESETGGAGAGGDDGDLSKMFLGMMEQLTNKDMLYEPMKELSTKYPEWLEQNRAKLDKAEFDRFSRQRVIVDEIVAKFEEAGYSDDNAQCREFVWEKMQAMQGEGAPPEDLIANPFPGMGMPGLGLGDDAEKLEEGCPTQ